MMTFNDFVRKYDLRKRATSNIKLKQVLDSIGLYDVGIYLRDGPFESNIGIVNLHPTKGTHSVCYIIENYFDSYGVLCPKNQSKFIIKRNKYCLYCEYQN